MSYLLFIEKKSTNFVFSLSFALLLPFIVLFFPIFMILFHLIFFPFSLMHEVGHFLLSLWLLPSHEPIFHYQIIEGELNCSCELSHELMCCWTSIIVILGGPCTVILSVLIILFLLTRSNNQNFVNLGKPYLLFGLLSDLPNLFPILPSVINAPTDGFILYSFLSQMAYIPPLSSGVSYFFSLASFIIVLMSFYFLGSFIYQFIILLLKKRTESSIAEVEELNLQA
jgi:hypothetical protein